MGSLLNELLQHPAQFCIFAPFIQPPEPHLHGEEFPLACLKLPYHLFLPVIPGSFPFFKSTWIWCTCFCCSCTYNWDALPLSEFYFIYCLFLAVSGLSCSMGYLRCGTWALQLWFEGLVARGIACGILVSQVGIEPMSPALQGGFLTPGPPGKSLLLLLSSFSRVQLCATP